MDDDRVTPQEDGNDEIAVVGLAGRFPGGRDLDRFWANIRDGVESIVPLTDQELKADGIPSEWLKDPRYVKVGTPLEDVDKFDAAFFGYPPKEAENIDPQQRIFLETAWEAIENAGYDPEIFEGPIGLFAGANVNDYLEILPPPSDISDSAGALERLIGNEKDFLCTRVSYKLNLR
jgi:acyl transferase domain-containing protein